MLRKLITYIFLLLACAAGLTSCSDILDPGSDIGTGEMRTYKGTLTFNLSMPDATQRSRALNTNAGATVIVNNMWVGVFDVSNGQCIGAARYDELNRSMQSGVVFNKLIKVDFVASSENLPLAYVAAVANYDGVRTWDGTALSDLLPDNTARASITWDKLVSFGIDTESAYAGTKGEKDDSNAPFLVGYFQDAVSLTQNPKIDQFVYEETGPTAIYPQAAAEGMDIQLGDASDDDIYVAAGAICLRRLVSHNSVNINLINGYEVTDLQYKRFNMPRAVFMLQRRTDVKRYDSFAEWQKNSPNYADHLLTEGNYEGGNPRFPYFDDSDWNRVEIGAFPESVNFVFDHFENLHWGTGHLQTQSDREALNPDGTFAALCSGNNDAYNNFASYFVLRMHIINKQTGESADVEYTLHEGFCNTADGRRAETLADKCHDFSSYRNVNYTYNVNIAGFTDITSAATSDDPGVHLNGQSGTIWQMNYANGKSKTSVPTAGGEYDFNGQYMTFGANPDLGFRIYGRDANNNLVDVCYNVPDGMLEGLSGLWPDGVPVYIPKDGNLSSAGIPQKLLDAMVFGDGTRYYNVVELLNGINNGTVNPSSRFTLKFDEYDTEGLTGNFMRGVYVFDRNDSRNGTDSDGCSAYRVVYGCEQYPFTLQKIDFDSSNIMWDNLYYKFATDKSRVFAATTPIFYGAETSTIDIRWKHDARISGYAIDIYNDEYTHPTITVTGAELQKCIHEVKGELIFIYPLNTVDFPRSTGTGAKNYSFAITPIVDTSMYLPCETVYITHKMLGEDSTCIRVCPPIWDVTSTNDWKVVDIAINDTYEVHYRGLHLIGTSATETKYSTPGKFICFGGGGNVDNRCFIFTASVPGKFAVTAKSHSASDPNRPIVILRENPSGSIVSTEGIRFEEVYNSKTIGTSNTTYEVGVQLYNGQPTQFRIYATASVDFVKIQFKPN